MDGRTGRERDCVRGEAECLEKRDEGFEEEILLSPLVESEYLCNKGSSNVKIFRSLAVLMPRAINILSLHDIVLSC